MRPPSEPLELSAFQERMAGFPRGGLSVERAMDSVAIVIILELLKLSWKISAVPEQNLIQIFALDCSDQPLDEGTGDGHIRDGLDFLHLKDPQVRLPLRKGEQRIMIRTEIGRDSHTVDGSIRHAADGDSIDRPGLDREPDDPAGVLVHDHHHPVALQSHQFASKQIDAPEAVPHMANKRQP